MQSLLKETREALKEMLLAFESDHYPTKGEQEACHKARKAIERIDNVRHCCEIDCDNVATQHIEFSDKLEDSSDFCDYCLIGNMPNGRRSVITPIKS